MDWGIRRTGMGWVAVTADGRRMVSADGRGGYRELAVGSEGVQEQVLGRLPGGGYGHRRARPRPGGGVDSEWVEARPGGRSARGKGHRLPGGASAWVTAHGRLRPGGNRGPVVHVPGAAERGVIQDLGTGIKVVRERVDGKREIIDRSTETKGGTRGEHESIVLDRATGREIASAHDRWKGTKDRDGNQHRDFEGEVRRPDGGTERVNGSWDKRADGSEFWHHETVDEQTGHRTVEEGHRNHKGYGERHVVEYDKDGRKVKDEVQPIEPEAVWDKGDLVAENDGGQPGDPDTDVGMGDPEGTGDEGPPSTPIFTDHRDVLEQQLGQPEDDPESPDRLAALERAREDLAKDLIG
ncbi:MAG TPA: hypothetical protein VD931_14775, partial [Baekduia sp.]|nr:hypothetical protein [Baekduia sp.]